MAFLTESGREVAIGPLIAKGALGDIYEVIGDREVLAKMYHKPLLERGARKLRYMIEHPPQANEIFAWPLAVLQSAADQPVRGMLVPRKNGSLLSALASPASRRLKFPHVDWRFLVKAACSCAQRLDVVHKSSIVLGDVHPDRFLVHNDGNVTVVDCDSLQISGDDEVFYCTQAVAEYLAPELHTMPLESFLQTANHDAFGLAVVIFQLLMLDRHPYVGYEGGGRMTIARAIQEYRYAEGSSAASLMMSPPPNGLLISDLPVHIGGLFKRAFATGSERPGGRPSAHEWSQALSELERSLRICDDDSAHVYPSGSQCPWCRIEREGGPNHFVALTAQSLQALPEPLRVQTFSERLEAIVTPEHYFTNISKQLQSRAVVPPLPREAYEHQQFVYGFAAVVAGSLVLMALGWLLPNFFYIGLPLAILATIATGVAYFFSPLCRARRRRRQMISERAAALTKAERLIETSSARRKAEFAARFKEAASTRDRWRELQDQEDRELKLLQASARERQLDEFLGTFLVRDAKIMKLDFDRLLILQSYGIETARDVSERALATIHGLGKTMPAGLITWRRNLEGQFRYDPSRELPLAQVTRLRKKYRQPQLSLQEQLEIDLEALTAISAAAAAEATEVVRILKEGREFAPLYSHTTANEPVSQGSTGVNAA